MLARSLMPWGWVAWNGDTGAPFGGPYALYFANCTSRVFEYPWVVQALRPRPGERVLDVGGGLSGLAITLAQMGVDAHVVDPAAPPLLEAWARQWNTRVTAHRGTVDALDLAPGTFDGACCVSVIEHIEEPAERGALIAGAARLLRPGARFVITLDLDLELAPFTDRLCKPECRNVAVPELVEAGPFEMEEGVEEELFGFAAFEPEQVQARARSGELLLSHGHLLTQCFVLRRR